MRRFGVLLLLAALIGSVRAAPQISVEQPEGTKLGQVVAWGSNSDGQTRVSDSLRTVVAIASGGSHTVALRGNGSIVSWGANRDGQATVPNGLAGVTAIDAGEIHSVALKGDGTVVAWGSNSKGQTTVPAGLTGVTAIAAGPYHTVVLKGDGTVVAWGLNTDGQSTVPAGLTEVIAIAAGANHTAALRSDGRVVAWGSNALGQTTVPVGLMGAVAIAAGLTHNVALMSDGSVVAWGSNTYGERVVPAGLTGVTAVSAGRSHTIALKGDGTVVAWGSNASGQTTVPAGLNAVTAVAGGDGHTVVLQRAVTFNDRSPDTPGAANIFTIKNIGSSPLALGGASVIEGSGADFIVDTTAMAPSVSAFGGSTSFAVTFVSTTGGARRATLRILSDDPKAGTLDIVLKGKVLGPEIGVSGHGVDLVKGDTTPSASEDTDFGGVNIVGGAVVRQFTIANPGTATLHLTGSPRVALSGANAADFTLTSPPASMVAAQHGTTTFQLTFSPAAIGPRLATVSIASDDYDENPFDFAIQGVGVAAPNIVIEQPEAASTVPDRSVVAWGRNVEGQTTPPAGLTGVIAVAAGRSHTMALKADSSVAAWGDNTYGQRNVPPGLVGVEAIAAGEYHSVAMKGADIVAWGRNDGGQTTIPAGLGGGIRLVAVAAGRFHGLVVRSGGQVFAWGSNVNGQTTIPAGLNNAAAVAAGHSHSVALRTDGTAVAWGSNDYGQTNVPSGLAGVTAIAAGHYHTLALTSTGTVVAWGRNLEGQTDVPFWLTGVKSIAADSYQSLALKIDGSIVAWGSNDFDQTTVPGGLRPITAVEAGGLHTVALQPNLFENQAIRTTSAAKTFTIRNTGSAPLAITSVSVTGGNASDFTVNTDGMLTTLPAVTGSTIFTVAFTPTALLGRRSTLRVVTDDPDEGTLDILLTGIGKPVGPALAAYQGWAAVASLSDAAALPVATPYGDGVPNLLKYAFNMNGEGPDRSQLIPHTGTQGLPVVLLTTRGSDTFLRMEFLRRRNAGLIYTPQMSFTLGSFNPMTGTPVVTAIDAEWERVVVEEPLADPTPQELFTRVSVVLP